ncbi:hypothetical protein NE237_004131 [Protea cynaroides]|uniref:Uncharacterized protein n=1 Tax=Protea cynaroides TaxID=273540 RepID=A0A9Q0KI80_9MAGN|nr:hypothetical protein NE237_004131 [Protea cynaroides]
MNRTLRNPHDLGEPENWFNSEMQAAILVVWFSSCVGQKDRDDIGRLPILPLVREASKGRNGSAKCSDVLCSSYLGDLVEESTKDASLGINERRSGPVLAGNGGMRVQLGPSSAKMGETEVQHVNNPMPSQRKTPQSQVVDYGNVANEGYERQQGAEGEREEMQMLMVGLGVPELMRTGVTVEARWRNESKLEMGIENEKGENCWDILF